MSKQTKKKNFFQVLEEIDAAQQAQISGKKRTGKGSEQPQIKFSSTTKATLIIATIALPWVAWGVGAMLNPTGWSSSDPSMVLLTLAVYAISAWFVSIPWAIFIIYLLIKKRAAIALLVIFLTSFVMSLIIFNNVSTASESEFTG